MSLDEAIKHLEESLADDSKEWTCESCKQEHEQLLEWLRELRERRSVARENMTDEEILRAYDELRDRRLAMI